MKIRVFILTRAITLNPADATVLNALHQMGFGGMSSTRLGRYFEIEFDDSLPAEARLTQINHAFHPPLYNLSSPII